MKKVMPFLVAFLILLIYALARIAEAESHKATESSRGAFVEVAMIDAPAPLKNFGAQPYLIPLPNQGSTFTVEFEGLGGSVVVTTDPVLSENVTIQVLDLSTGGKYIPGLAEPGKPFSFEKTGAGKVVFYVRASDNSDTQFWVELVVPQIQP